MINFMFTVKKKVKKKIVSDRDKLDSEKLRLKFDGEKKDKPSVVVTDKWETIDVIKLWRRNNVKNFVKIDKLHVRVVLEGH